MKDIFNHIFIIRQQRFLTVYNQPQVGVGCAWSILIKCYLIKIIQCYNCIVFLISLWYLILRRAIFLAITNIIPIYVIFVHDRVSWGEIKVMTDMTLVCALSGRYLYFLMMKLDWKSVHNKVDHGCKIMLIFFYPHTILV